MGSGKKDMASGGGGHSSTLLINRPIKATSPHLVSALKAIWASLVPPPPAHDTLSLADFTSFLRTTQQEPDSAIPRILADVLPPGQSHVAYPDFERYMCTPHANILRLPGKKSDEDESHPLAEYFISSSHNTYLVGHQLYGDSTTAGYINVLRRGCRCIEIDVWDGDGGEPEVFHGWTLTKEISFVDVCKAIREHAFWSDAGEEVMGPVVISLECHCTAKQQERMVQIMKEVWRGLLVEQPICGAGSVHEVHRVPTLKELKGKILVKTKYHPPDPAAADVPHNLSQLSLTSPSTPKRSKPDPSTSNRPSSSSSTSSEDSSSDEELLELARLTGNRKPPKPKITRSLSNLAIYVSATHFPGTFTPPVPFRATTVFSFSEKVFASHLSTFPQDLPAHNLTRFMRVYPFGLRFSSSNADPTVFWRRGVQLVALNWQKTDAGMMLNEGMFAGEGGYVLKPPHFRPGPGNTPPPAPPPRRKIDFEIEVLAAQDLPLPDKDDRPSSFEPYIKVELHLDDPTPQTSSSSSSSTTSSGDIDPENIKSRTRKAANKGTSATWTPPPKSGKRFSRKIFSRRGGDTGGDGEGEVVLGEEGEKKKSKRIGEVVKFRGVDGVRDPAMCFLRVKVHDEEFGRDDLAGWGCWRMDRVRRGWRVVRLFDRGGRGSEGVVLVRVGWRVV